ncbi:GLUT4 regulating protein TUG-domain-containing protein [Madurella fahalii]|uniref:GLUT4 regulating protein TUG-domain-containing protein n=1 Tax=Madurella fahalii TaxID=1157608 RepID=A0ABQ0FY14_9PEZI
MAAHVEVVATDLRRAKVKVTPGTYMVDVLGEACKKLNLKSDKYELKHKNKIVDLTGPYRTSGLGPGAKLELVQKSKSASVVSIALDVNGQRYTKKLPSDMTLWMVLRQFESAEHGLNITDRGVAKGTNSGQLYYEAPLVNIMGREYSALEDLQKTLSQCGINSGSIVLRVSFKVTETTLFDAMKQISQYLNDVEPEQPKAEVTGAQEAAPLTGELNADAVPDRDGLDTQREPTTSTNIEGATATAPVDSESGTNLTVVDEPFPVTTAPTDPLQPTSVFSAPSSSTPAAARIHEDDAVYEPTIAHAQLRQQHLQQRSQNTRLKSDAELAADAAEEATRLAKITQVEVKIRFPDQTSATWTVTPNETGAFLYRAIRGVMAHPTQPFKLIIPGPKIVIQEDDKRLVAGYRLKGREMLHLLWDGSVSEAARRGPFLKGSVASKAQEVVVPEVPQGDPDDDGKPTAGPSTRPVKTDKEKSGLDPDAVKKKLSKFLGLSKK